jgi:translation elongation factor EF-1alpha
LAVGDKIKFARGGDDLFEQTVDSIQIEHEKKDSAGKGDVIGLKTNEQVKEGTEVFKI